MSKKRKVTRRASAPRHLAPPQSPERAADLQLVAAWRYPDHPKAQRDFRQRYQNAFMVGDRNWDPKDPGVLSLTREEVERLDMVRRAKRLEDGAEREMSRETTSPRNPVDADSPESIEWSVSAIHAPRILELAQRAQHLIAAGHWSAARSLILEAELEHERASRMLRRPEDRRVAEEIRRLAPLKQRLAQNIRHAGAARDASACKRKAKVRVRADEMLAKGRARTDLTKLLSEEFLVSERTIRRDLESLPGRAAPRATRSSP